MSVVAAICWGLVSGFALGACTPAAARSTLARERPGPWRRTLEGSGPYLLRDLGALMAAWLVAAWLLPPDPRLELTLILGLAAVLLLRGAMLVEAGARICFVESELPEWRPPRAVARGFLRRPDLLLARVAILVPVALLVGGGAGGTETIPVFSLGVALGFLGLVGALALHQERQQGRDAGPHILGPRATRMLFSLAGLILFAGAFLLLGRSALDFLGPG